MICKLNKITIIIINQTFFYFSLSQILKLQVLNRSYIVSLHALNIFEEVKAIKLKKLSYFNKNFPNLTIKAAYYYQAVVFCDNI